MAESQAQSSSVVKSVAKKARDHPIPGPTMIAMTHYPEPPVCPQARQPSL
jgi:hypothetical protein